MAPIRLRVTFTGSAREHVQDVERWILLSENERYLRHSRAAKPYEGFRSLDVCDDTLTWSGVVTIRRL